MSDILTREEVDRLLNSQYVENLQRAGRNEDEENVTKKILKNIIPEKDCLDDFSERFDVQRGLSRRVREELIPDLNASRDVVSEATQSVLDSTEQLTDSVCTASAASDRLRSIFEGTEEEFRSFLELIARIRNLTDEEIKRISRNESEISEKNSSILWNYKHFNENLEILFGNERNLNLRRAKQRFEELEIQETTEKRRRDIILERKKNDSLDNAVEEMTEIKKREPKKSHFYSKLLLVSSIALVVAYVLTHYNVF